MASEITYSISLDIKLDMCRTCLVKEGEFYSIFDNCHDFDDVSFDSMISVTTGLKVLKGDGLPPFVCSQCKIKAINAFHFKKQSQEADIVLKDLFKDKVIEEAPDTKQNFKSEIITDVKEEFNNEGSFSYDDEQFAYSQSDECPDIDIKNEDVEDIPLLTNLQCKVCSDILGTEEALKQHTLICVKVLEKGSSTCPMCDIKFTDDKKLSKHMWSEHSDVLGPRKRGRPKKIFNKNNDMINSSFDPYQLKLSADNSNNFYCGICKSLFKSRDELILHLRGHKVTKIFCCILCKKMYLKKIHFEKHDCQGLKNSNLEDIKICGDLVTNIDKKLDSSVKHYQSLDFLMEVSLENLSAPDGNMGNFDIFQVCSHCSEIFISLEEFLNHNDIQHQDHSQRCCYCSKIFASVKTAARHRQLCSQVERRHNCPTCGLKFAYEISLNKHILRYHEGQSVSVKFIDPKEKLNEKQFVCDVCGKCFYRQELLEKHLKVHSPGQKKYECDICKKKFNRTDNLKSHRRIHNRDRDNLQSSNCLCLYCGRGFSNSSNLIVHMRRHTGEKPYKCDFCQKGFPRSSDLQCHRRSHTGEKPCLCPICGKGFSRSNKLSRHMRVHTGHRPYECTYCEKAFSQSNDLTLHIRRHTGDKPYVCEVCGDRFIQGTALHNHRRIHSHYPLATIVKNDTQPVPSVNLQTKEEKFSEFSELSVKKNNVSKI